MKPKKQESFLTSNAPETSGAYTGYGSRQTSLSDQIYDTFVQKSELGQIKENITLKIDNLIGEISSCKGVVEKVETRFWIINGVLLASLIAIFLFALPYVYYYPLDKKANQIIELFNEKVQAIDDFISSQNANP